MINVKNVTYVYKNSNSTILDNINLNINKRRIC